MGGGSKPSWSWGGPGGSLRAFRWGLGPILGPDGPPRASPSMIVTHFGPTWAPKGAPRTPQDGPLGPPKSDDVNEDFAFFHFPSYVETRVEDGIA